MIIASTRPAMPTDEVIQAKVDHWRNLESLILWGAGDFNKIKTIYLCDKRGFVQETVTTGEKKTTVGLADFIDKAKGRGDEVAVQV